MPGHVLALKLVPLVILTVGLVCMMLGLLWNRHRQRTLRGERALALNAPISTERKRVSLYLRHGATAPDPDLAHLTVRVAADRRRRLENPWFHTGVSLSVFGSALNLIIGSLLGEGPVGLMWLGFAGIALAVGATFLRRAALDRADRALAANLELAELYEVPEEKPAPPRER